jgi:hypothetical protein
VRNIARLSFLLGLLPNSWILVKLFRRLWEAFQIASKHQASYQASQNSIRLRMKRGSSSIILHHLINFLHLVRLTTFTFSHPSNMFLDNTLFSVQSTKTRSSKYSFVCAVFEYQHPARMTPIKLPFAVALQMLAFVASLVQARSYSSSKVIQATETRSWSANQQVKTPCSDSILLPRSSERDAIVKDVDGGTGRLPDGPEFILCPQNDLCSHTSASLRGQTSSTSPHTPHADRMANLARVDALVTKLDNEVGFEAVKLLFDEMECMNKDYEKLWETYEAEVKLVDRLLDERGIKRVNLKVKRSKEDESSSGWLEDGLTFLVGTIGITRGILGLCIAASPFRFRIGFPFSPSRSRPLRHLYLHHHAYTFDPSSPPHMVIHERVSSIPNGEHPRKALSFND